MPSMQRETVHMGSKTAVIYYFSLFLLVGVGLLIIVGMFLSVKDLPPCTSISKNICGVNDWSIAGLAATILGVAATVLAFLGAFAVAAFWKDLDKQVATQVKELVEQLTKERLANISDTLQKSAEEYVDQRIKDMEIRAEERYIELEVIDNRIRDENRKLQNEVQNLQKSVNNYEIFFLEGIFTPLPWPLEPWASEWMAKAPTTSIASSVAYGMTIRYCKTIEEYLNAQKSGQPYPEKNVAPFDTLEEYLNAAKRWAQQTTSIRHRALTQSMLDLHEEKMREAQKNPNINLTLKQEDSTESSS